MFIVYITIQKNQMKCSFHCQSSNRCFTLIYQKNWIHLTLSITRINITLCLMQHRSDDVLRYIRISTHEGKRIHRPYGLWGILPVVRRNSMLIPDSKVYGANIGPTWVLSAPDGPLVGPMNLAIRDLTSIDVLAAAAQTKWSIVHIYY